MEKHRNGFLKHSMSSEHLRRRNKRARALSHLGRETCLEQDYMSTSSWRIQANMSEGQQNLTGRLTLMLKADE